MLPLRLELALLAFGHPEASAPEVEFVEFPMCLRPHFLTAYRKACQVDTLANFFGKNIFGSTNHVPPASRSAVFKRINFAKDIIDPV